MEVENAQIVVYSFYVEPGGKRNQFGPSLIDRTGNSLVFRDFPRAFLRFEGTHFFRKRDGSLGSTRHWNYARGRIVDYWTTTYPDRAVTQ